MIRVFKVPRSAHAVQRRSRSLHAAPGLPLPIVIMDIPIIIRPQPLPGGLMPTENVVTVHVQIQEPEEPVRHHGSVRKALDSIGSKNTFSSSETYLPSISRNILISYFEGVYSIGRFKMILTQPYQLLAKKSPTLCSN